MEAPPAGDAGSSSQPGSPPGSADAAPTAAELRNLPPEFWIYNYKVGCRRHLCKGLFVARFTTKTSDRAPGPSHRLCPARTPSHTIGRIACTATKVWLRARLSLTLLSALASATCSDALQQPLFDALRVVMQERRPSGGTRPCTRRCSVQRPEQ